MRRSAWFLALALTASMVALVGGPAGAGHPGDTVFVDASNPDCGSADGSAAAPFCTIQEGIDHANPGDTVDVAAGTYTGPGLTIPAGKHITLRGAGRDDTLVEVTTGGNDNAGIWIGFQGQDNSVTIEGIHLENVGTARRGISIRGRGSAADPGIVRNNRIEGFTLDGGIVFPSVNTFEWRIYHNEFIDNRWLAFLNNASNVEITSNTSVGHLLGVTQKGSSISQDVGSDITIVDNVFSDPDPTQAFTFGLHLTESAHDMTATGNKITGHTHGVRMGNNTGHPQGLQNLDISLNCIEGNTLFGGFNSLDSPPRTLDLTRNWWGDASGPTHASNPGGSGDTVSDNVDFDPWLTDLDYTGATSFQEGDDVVLETTLLDSDGVGVAGVKVEFFVDGSSVGTATTDGDGVASLNIGPQPEGSYTVRAEALHGCLEVTETVEVVAAANVPTSKDDCKKGGWMSRTDDEGRPFKNQGDCVSYVATGGKKKAKG